MSDHTTYRPHCANWKSIEAQARSTQLDTDALRQALYPQVKFRHFACTTTTSRRDVDIVREGDTVFLFTDRRLTENRAAALGSGIGMTLYDIDGSVGYAVVAPNDDPDLEIGVVTSLFTPEGKKMPWVRIEMYQGSEPYMEDGRGMVVELPVMPCMFLIRHLWKAVQDAIGVDDAPIQL